MTTSNHTLASVSADLVANGIPRHFGEYAQDTSEPAQFPNHLCWFLDEVPDNHRHLLVWNPGSSTTELEFDFIPAYCPDALDHQTWRLATAHITYDISTRYGVDRTTLDYDHTCIREAVALLAFIDRHNAKHGIKTA